MGRSETGFKKQPKQAKDNIAGGVESTGVGMNRHWGAQWLTGCVRVNLEAVTGFSLHRSEAGFGWIFCQV